MTWTESCKAPNTDNFKAKSTSSEVLGKYYQELGINLYSNNLLHKQERIYNIDETGVPTEHSTPKKSV